MNYRNLDKYIISEVSDFKKIFEDNQVMYSINSITDGMEKLLNGKTIIFKEGFSFTGLYEENIKNIFDKKYVKKKINDDGVFRNIKLGYSEVRLNNIDFGSELIDITENIYFINCAFNKLELKANRSDNNLNISGGIINELYINEVKNINKISLTSIDKINNILINNLVSINSLDININEIGNIIMDNCFFEGKQFSFRNSVIQKAELINCNLGEMQFNGVKFIKLGFLHTTFNNCIFNNTNFPDLLEMNICEELISIDNEEQKDNYRQLKHVMDKNANYTEANRFYSLEMLYYARYIQNGKNYSFLEILKNEFKCNNSKKYGELIILTIGALINDFGTNILKNLFIIWGYIVSIYSISFISNFIGRFICILILELNQYFNTQIDINIDLIYSIGHMGGIVILFIIIYLLEKFKINLTEKIFYNKNNILGFIMLSLAYIIILSLSLNDIANFKGIETFTYLLNPFSGLTDKSMMNLLWTEQIGMIIHKVIYGVLIYQLIIALKRTTKR